MSKKGALEKTIRSILDEQKPEAVYFLASNGIVGARLAERIFIAAPFPLDPRDAAAEMTATA